MARSAIIVRASEAESVVGELRSRFDSTVALDVPAHITVLYPFMPPENIDEAVLGLLRDAIRGVGPFDFCLAKTGRFPGVLYLAAEPSFSFIELTRRIAHQFPEFPPYGGQFASVIPHLTVSDGGDAQADAAEIQLISAMKRHGPVGLRCEELTILEDSSGRWKEMHVISLS
jgi:2'-5' RNA ligase